VNDNQKTAVLAAINVTSQPLTTSPERLMDEACRELRISSPRLRVGSTSGFSVAVSTTTLSSNPSEMTVLHAAAHLATDRVFPAHGAEFCANLLAVASALVPYQAELLRHELDAHGVHYTAAHRRRAVIKAVTQRATDGTRVVEAVLDDPPQTTEGSFAYDRPWIVVGGERLAVDRLRYLAKVS
jgi:hypothetical protein